MGIGWEIFWLVGHNGFKIWAGGGGRSDFVTYFIKGKKNIMGYVENVFYCLENEQDI